MIKEIIATGADVPAAIESGCLLLGIDSGDAQFDIISLPKKGMLGLRRLPAKVRVYAEFPDEPKPREPQPKREYAPAPAPKNTPAPAPAARHAAPEGTAPAAEPAEGDISKKKHDRHKKNKRGGQGEGAFQPERSSAPRAEVEPTPEVIAKTERAKAYVTSILAAMGFEELEIKPFYYEENVRLQLGGERLGSVIGRRGETLDALQYLASLVANRGESDYLRINIDSGNYREKRERTLEALARKLAGGVLRTGRSVTLEPMNPYERRIIHGTVSSINGVTSSSVGVEPNRKVVITADGSVPPSDPSGERPERGGNSRGRSGNGGGRGRFGGGGGRSGGSGSGSGNGGGRGRFGGSGSGDRPDRGERGSRRDDPPAIGGPVNHEPLPKPERSEAEKEIAKSTSLYGKIEL